MIKSEILRINEVLEKQDLGKEKSQKIPEIYEKMYERLAKYDDFAKRLAIVTDTLENVFRLINGEKLLTYEEYEVLRAHRLCKIHKKLKRVKRVKKCKI